LTDNVFLTHEPDSDRRSILWKSSLISVAVERNQVSPSGVASLSDLKIERILGKHFDQDSIVPSPPFHTWNIRRDH
jgi:hypothetical protein